MVLINKNNYVPFNWHPITSFQQIEITGETQLLISGNSFTVYTYHGDYSSLKGLLVQDLNNFKLVSDFGIDPFNKQIKPTPDLKIKVETFWQWYRIMES